MHDTRKRIHAYCDRIGNRIRKSPAGILVAAGLSEDSLNECSNRLKRILLTAAEIAVSLWTQESSLVTYGLADMYADKRVFKITSDLLQGHPLSRVDLDDESHNGREILVVTRPALLVFDKHGAARSEENAFRILVKAVVLLGDKKD